MAKNEKKQVSDNPKPQVSRGHKAVLNQLPSFRSAMAMAALHDDSSHEYIAETLAQLEKQSQLASSGDLGRMESILVTQAHVLNSIFTKYVTTAHKAELLEQFGTYMGIALKAQNQSRQTIAVLGELQNPKRTTFIKQQNNAINQQINQSDTAQPATADELLEEKQKISANPENKLLEMNDEWMVGRTQKKAKPANSELETVEKVHGSNNDGRKTKVRSKRD